MRKRFETIGFGGGCHWCTEAVFQALRGVTSVAQGFIRSDPPHDAWSEAVDVTFEADAIELATLIDVHLRTHSSTRASTQPHKLRDKYRSAIYVHDDAQKTTAENALAQLQSEFADPLVTLVLPHRGFRASEERFHDYYARDPDRPFCRTYIDPKLAVLRQRFAKAMKAEG